MTYEETAGHTGVLYFPVVEKSGSSGFSAYVQPVYDRQPVFDGDQMFFYRYDEMQYYFTKAEAEAELKRRIGVLLVNLTMCFGE